MRTAEDANNDGGYIINGVSKFEMNKPQIGWAVVNKKTGKIHDDFGFLLICSTRKKARNVLKSWFRVTFGSIYPRSAKIYTIKRIDLNP